MISEASIALLILENERDRNARAIERERRNIRESLSRIEKLRERQSTINSKMLVILGSATSECLVYERDTNAFVF